MIKIDLQNIQAIGTAQIELPENSITEFSGDNSNGKSILSKVIQALTSGDIKHKDVRRTLIKDGTDCGIVSIIHDGRQLGLILKEEISESFITYTDDVTDQSKFLTRSLGDAGGVQALIKKFGFRVYSGGDICLQLSPTWGAIPFITTSGSVNNDIVQEITVDRIAQQFLDSFKTITYPAFRQRLKNNKNEQEHIHQLLDNMENYDWRSYEDLSIKMQEVLDILNGYTFLKVDVLKLAPKPIDIGTYDLHVRPIPMPQIFLLAPKVQPIEAYGRYIQLINGICPTCGRRFHE